MFCSSAFSFYAAAAILSTVLSDHYPEEFHCQRRIKAEREALSVEEGQK